MPKRRGTLPGDADGTPGTGEAMAVIVTVTVGRVDRDERQADRQVRVERHLVRARPEAADLGAER